MIKCVLVLNTAGDKRLVLFYEELPQNERERIIALVYRECTRHKQCSFSQVSWNQHTLVHRLVQNLYFVFVIDEGENELAILDLIQVFIEGVGQAVGGLTETNLMLHSDKAYAFANELFMGGAVAETSLAEVATLSDLLAQQERRS